MANAFGIFEISDVIIKINVRIFIFNFTQKILINTPHLINRYYHLTMKQTNSLFRKFISLLKTWPELSRIPNKPSWITGLAILNDSECEELIRIGISNELNFSSVVSKKGVEINYRRTSNEMTITNAHSTIIGKIIRYASLISGKPISHIESVQLIRYETGQSFEPHFDFFEFSSLINQFTGDRIGTLIIYLNDNYNGGETIFNDLNLSIKGKAGRAIYFDNYIGNEKNSLSRHSGNIVSNGTKWIIVTFITEFHQFQHEMDFKNSLSEPEI